MCFDCIMQDLSKEEKTEDVKELTSASAEGSDCYEAIVFNPNVFTEFKLAGSQEVVSESFYFFYYSIFALLLVFTLCVCVYLTIYLSIDVSQTLCVCGFCVNTSWHTFCTQDILTIAIFDCIHQEIAADEDNVRKVSLYLNDVVLPKFIQDLCTLEVSPMDGQTLTEALHAHGINVRYIGKVRTLDFGQCSSNDFLWRWSSLNT